MELLCTQMDFLKEWDHIWIDTHAPWEEGFLETELGAAHMECWRQSDELPFWQLYCEAGEEAGACHMVDVYRTDSNPAGVFTNFPSASSGYWADHVNRTIAL